MNMTEFKQGLLLLTSTGLTPRIEPTKLTVWFELLKDLDSRHFRQAVSNICKECTEFYPTTNVVAVIRNEAKRIKQREEPEPVPPERQIGHDDSFQKTFTRYIEEACSPEEAREIIEQNKRRIN